jgi:predicted permease
LSKLIFSVLQPCLLFVNVASTIENLGKGATGSSAAPLYINGSAFVQLV